jgi:hypothetical protein
MQPTLTEKINTANHKTLVNKFAAVMKHAGLQQAKTLK